MVISKNKETFIANVFFWKEKYEQKKSVLATCAVRDKGAPSLEKKD